ncbi:hypothetical protein H2198_005670 [Neophaeococcomyces mojaviensis]|uniref:Uncharacterized protein n=1 Tax=Neophaeococcomyces mojaviensis TaxID=3383035 RepID=A0ACC3A593_9EURO|nr:hypothetical protein H2198_005670 [Knufia sp. JES_112]
MAQKYNDIILEVRGKIGIIKLNRPKSLNAFGGTLIMDVIAGLRELNEHPDTVFTVLTGEGRFFSSGADVKAEAGREPEEFKNDAEKKVSFMSRFSYAIELLRSVIDHKKVFVLALNGPGVGGGAAWFQGVADIVLAAEGAWLQVPFNALGLVPENGSAIAFAQSMGVHRANDFLMFGRKCTVEELEQWGMVNRIFPAQGFHQSVTKFLEEQLDVNDGKSMMETKRLQNAPRRTERMMAVFDAMEALAERFVEGAPAQRFRDKKALLEGEIAVSNSFYFITNDSSYSQIERSI